MADLNLKVSDKKQKIKKHKKNEKKQIMEKTKNVGKSNNEYSKK